LSRREQCSAAGCRATRWSISSSVSCRPRRACADAKLEADKQALSADCPPRLSGRLQG